MTTTGAAVKGVGAVLLCGAVLLTAACGGNREQEPSAEQTEWYDRLSRTLDGLPQDCVAVGPSCSGFVTAVDTRLTELLAAVDSWENADRFRSVREAAEARHEAAEEFDTRYRATRPASGRAAIGCQGDLNELIEQASLARGNDSSTRTTALRRSAAVPGRARRPPPGRGRGPSLRAAARRPRPDRPIGPPPMGLRRPRPAACPGPRPRRAPSPPPGWPMVPSMASRAASHGALWRLVSRSQIARRGPGCDRSAVCSISRRNFRGPWGLLMAP